jgi:endoglucanase
MPNSVQVTPNPTSGIIIIKFPTQVKEADITLQNIDGGIMLKKKLYNVCSTSIDLSYFKGGTYILKVISDNQTAFFKLIVI